MEYLGDKPIAVLGGGATGQLQAADCALAGREVRLAEHPDFEQSIEPFKDSGEIRVSGEQVNKYGFRRDGVAEIDVVTTDFEEALDGVGIVVVSIPSVGYEPFFERLIPHLEDGMVVHLFPGNFGSLMLEKMMRAEGTNASPVIGGWSSQPYGVRVKREHGVQLPEVGCSYRAITLRGASLPTDHQGDFVESTRYLPSMDSVVEILEGDTVVDIGFSNVNPVLHVPGTLLCLGSMENYGVVFGDDKQNFSIYSHGFCPSISEVQSAFYEEVRNIADAMEVGIHPYEHEDFFSRDNVLGEEYLGPDAEIPFDEHHVLFEGTGPFSVHNRYLTEDIPIGCYIYYELAQKFGVDTPLIEAMITIGSVVTGTDYYDQGRTLEDLGIAHMAMDELLEYLHHGRYVEP